MTPPPPLVILQDTREPSPEHDGETAQFRPAVLVKGEPVRLTIERRKLDVGDYSLPGLEQLVAVERKTVPDLLGTLFGKGMRSTGEATENLARFVAELGRMRGHAFKAIVVEGDLRAVYDAAREPGRRFNPVAVVCLLHALHVDFGVPAIWAGNRLGAEVFVGAVLRRIWEQAHGGDARDKAEKRGYLHALPWAAQGVAAATEAPPSIPAGCYVHDGESCAAGYMRAAGCPRYSECARGANAGPPHAPPAPPVVHQPRPAFEADFPSFTEARWRKERSRRDAQAPAERPTTIWHGGA